MLTAPDKINDRVNGKLGVIGNKEVMLTCNHNILNSTDFKRMYNAANLKVTPNCVTLIQPTASSKPEIIVLYIYIINALLIVTWVNA